MPNFPAPGLRRTALMLALLLPAALYAGMPARAEDAPVQTISAARAVLAKNLNCAQLAERMSTSKVDEEIADLADLHEAAGCPPATDILIVVDVEIVVVSPVTFAERFAGLPPGKPKPAATGSMASRTP